MRETLLQMARFGVAGVLNNLLGYLIYLFVTWLGLDPKVAVSLLYPIGMVTGYFAYARFAFGSEGATPSGILRYLVAHAAGFAVNLLILFVFVDTLKLPHQVVQAAAIVVVGGLLFLLFRFFVFRSKDQGTRLRS